MEFPHFPEFCCTGFALVSAKCVFVASGEMLFISQPKRSGLLPVLGAQRQDVGNRRRKKGHKTKEQGVLSPHSSIQPLS